MNKIMIIGRLCADPEPKQTASGISYSNFRVAVNRRHDKSTADFFHVVAWREMAENCCKYLKKGSLVGVSGWLEIQNYEQENVKRIAVKLNAEEVEFLSRANSDATDVSDKHNERIEEMEYAGKLPF